MGFRDTFDSTLQINIQSCFVFKFFEGVVTVKKVMGSFLVLSAIILSSVGASQVQVAKKQGCGKAGCPHVIELAKKHGPAYPPKKIQAVEQA